MSIATLQDAMHGGCFYQSVGTHGGCFYQSVGTFLVELSDDSPSSFHAVAKKVSKPHFCYVAKYDPSTNIGIIFLGSSSPQKHRQRFVRVHGGVDNPEPNALFTENLAFGEPFWLNVSHPLRVKLVYVSPPNTPPPHVELIRFKLDSEHKFWRAHRAYHVKRKAFPVPVLKTLVPSGGDGPGPSCDDGGNEEGQGPSGGNKEGPGPAGGNKEGTPLRPERKSYGYINGLEIGVDIPCILTVSSDESESDDEVEGNPHHIDGAVYVTDVVHAAPGFIK